MSFVCLRQNLFRSELLLDWGPWDIVDAIRLLDALIAWHLGTNSWHFSITNKWHSATAVGSLRCHCVEADDHCDDSTIEEDKSNCADGDNAVEEDLVIWLPLDVTVLVNLRRHTSGTWSDQNHDELDEQ